MPHREAQAPPTIIYVRVEFYRGVKAIAKFLGVHERTAQAFLHDGKIPEEGWDRNVGVDEP